MDRVEHDGRSLLRSTAQETLLEQFDAIDRRVERLWARIDAESRSGEVPFDAVDFDPPGRGANPERWLQNPAHLLGLHAVMGKLLEEQYVTCADAIELFEDTANSLVDYLASNVRELRGIPMVTTARNNLRVLQTLFLCFPIWLRVSHASLCFQVH